MHIEPPQNLAKTYRYHIELCRAISVATTMRACKQKKKVRVTSMLKGLNDVVFVHLDCNGMRGEPIIVFQAQVSDWCQKFNDF